MTKIIRPDFRGQDYELLVKEFLFASTHVSLSATLLEQAQAHLLQYTSSFVKLHLSFFEMKGNARFDEMVKSMESFLYTLAMNTEKAGELKETLILFWHQIADFLEDDYLEINEPYLNNTDRYFVFELRNLSLSPSGSLSKKKKA